jgi:hypothetical protein
LPVTRIQFNDRDRLDFEVTGYEFPEIDDGDYDSNWLMVRLAVHSRVGSWTVTEPCLLTWELAELVEAAGKAAKGLMDRDMELRFIEPNLAFFLRPLDDEKLEMTVEFDAECLPPGWPEDRSCRLLGRFSRQALEDIRSGLERDLTRYPVRT